MKTDVEGEVETERSIDDLDRWFTYHAPVEGQRERYIMLRDSGRALAKLIFELTPPGADQSAAIRKIREAIMTANASIACEHEVQTAYYARKFERHFSGDDKKKDEK
jgi:hypothetical protein